MQETLEPHTWPRLSSWRTEWNIADLLRAADAEGPVEEQPIVQDSEHSACEAGWLRPGNSSCGSANGLDVTTAAWPSCKRSVSGRLVRRLERWCGVRPSSMAAGC